MTQQLSKHYQLNTIYKTQSTQTTNVQTQQSEHTLDSSRQISAELSPKLTNYQTRKSITTRKSNSGETTRCYSETQRTTGTKKEERKKTKRGKAGKIEEGGGWEWEFAGFEKEEKEGDGRKIEKKMKRRRTGLE